MNADRLVRSEGEPGALLNCYAPLGLSGVLESSGALLLGAPGPRLFSFVLHMIHMCIYIVIYIYEGDPFKLTQLASVSYRSATVGPNDPFCTA